MYRHRRSGTVRVKANKSGRDSDFINARTPSPPPS